MDIVEWLREKAKGFFKPTSTRLKEAADEIERLREVNRKLIESSVTFQVSTHNALFDFEKTIDELEKDQGQ